MRISDWSSDVCSSDLVTGSSRWVGWSGSGAWRTTGSAAFPAEEAADDGAVEGGEDGEHDDPEQGGEDDREEQALHVPEERVGAQQAADALRSRQEQEDDAESAGVSKEERKVGTG